MCSFEKQKIEDKTEIMVEDKTGNKRLGTKSKSNCEQKNTWEIEISHATYYSGLIYHLINFIVKIYYNICCLILHVQLESSDLPSQGFFLNNA